jgi:hypothetical protein
LACALVAYALSIGGGSYHPVSLALVASALILLTIDLTVGWPRRAGVLLGWLTPAILAVTVAGGLWILASRPPGIFLPRETSLGWFQAGIAAAGVISLSYASRVLPRVRFPVLTLVFVLLGGWMIVHAPQPSIDVWIFQQHALDALRHGLNPYSTAYPNIYGNLPFYDQGVLKDGMVATFPYPPLTLLLDIPGWLAGDVRWSLMIATAVAAGFMVALGRRLGLPPGHWAELAAVAVMFHPGGFFLVEQSWTEPYVTLGLAANTWTLTTRSTAARSMSLSLALSAKQYSFWWIPPLLATRQVSWRALMWALAGVAVLHLPFLLWDPAALFEGVVLFQVRQPFRSDALSVLTLIGQVTGTYLPSAVGFVAGGLVLFAALWRAPHSIGRCLAATALAMLAFFAFNKQAFFNYYWLVGSVLALAAIASVASVHRQSPGGNP